MASVLVIAAHPQREHSRVNDRLWAAAAASHVQRRDLYALYPDYLIDIAAEQRALEAAQLVVWLQPIAELNSHAQTFAQRLASYPDWPEIDEIPACEVREVSPSERPVESH